MNKWKHDERNGGWGRTLEKASYLCEPSRAASTSAARHTSREQLLG